MRSAVWGASVLRVAVLRRCVLRFPFAGTSGLFTGPFSGLVITGLGLSVLRLPVLGFTVMGHGRVPRNTVPARAPVLGRAVVGRGLRDGWVARDGGVMRGDGRRLLPPAPLAGTRFARLVRFLRIAQDQAFPAAGLATA